MLWGLKDEDKRKRQEPCWKPWTPNKAVMEYPRPNWIRTIASNIDISGAPSLAVGPDDEVYFAVAATGTFGSLAATSTYDIAVGCMLGDGTLKWLFRDPSLVSGSNDSQPQIVLGLSGELYLAFVTPGAIPGRSNGADVPSLCGNCGATAGRQDVVFARLNGVVAATPSALPTVAWRVQDAYLNSCNNETAIRLHYDRVGSKLFLAYQTGGATLCTVAVGSPNIVVVAFDPAGYLVWSYQGELMNSTGSNTAPAIATDGIGGVYVAYEHTVTVAGGGTMQGTTDVEVIRLYTEGTPVRVVRDWVLSATTTINSAATNLSPALVADVVRNVVYLAFTATAAVPGGQKTASGADIVFAAIKSDATVSWLLQKPEYNEDTYRYSNIDSPRLSIDQYGVVYMAAHAVNDGTGQDQIVMIKLNPGTQEGWYFRVDIANVFRSYIPAADFVTPFQALLATSAFSVPGIIIYAGQLYVAFVRYGTSTLYIVGLAQVLNYLEYDAQEYMRSFTGICSSVRSV